MQNKFQKNHTMNEKKKIRQTRSQVFDGDIARRIPTISKYWEERIVIKPSKHIEILFPECLKTTFMEQRKRSFWKKAKNDKLQSIV